MNPLYEFHDADVEYYDGGIDWRRVAVEVVRAGITPRESLRLCRDDDRQVVSVVDDDLGEVAVIDAWRVRSFDPEGRLRAFVGASLEQVARTHGEDYAHHLVDAINHAEAMDINDDPYGPFVTVDVDGFPLAVIHRGNLVDSWPRTADGRFA